MSNTMKSEMNVAANIAKWLDKLPSEESRARVLKFVVSHENERQATEPGIGGPDLSP